MNISKLSILFISASLIQCAAWHHYPTEGWDVRPLITPQEYNNVVLTMTNYDVLHLTHRSGLDLNSLIVARVGIGTKVSAQYKELLSSTATVDAGFFVLHFDFTLKLDSSKIQMPLTIRYYAKDSSYTDADTSVDLYKYPYPSVQVVLSSTTGTFQDIERIGGKLYFHGLGPDGLHELVLNNNQTTYLYPYSGGDHIASDSFYVYCDFNHSRIDRYNISTGFHNLGIHFRFAFFDRRDGSFSSKPFSSHRPSGDIEPEEIHFDGSACRFFGISKEVLLFDDLRQRGVWRRLVDSSFEPNHKI